MIMPRRIGCSSPGSGGGARVSPPGRGGGPPPTIKGDRRRRSAIEPMIGHMKADGRLGRNHLLGAAGDAMNALLVAAGHNLRLILNWLRLFVAWLMADRH